MPELLGGPGKRMQAPTVWAAPHSAEPSQVERHECGRINGTGSRKGGGQTLTPLLRMKGGGCA